ncbi:MAG: hypothetical protein H0V81_00335 [Solirubrobacterales bacterium]|nr:hypothetical protein [Solirubrobacterales bacterium]
MRAITPTPQTTPPLHGTNPHGQGTVAVVDVNPDPNRPYSGDPTGRTDNEDIIVGRSRGEQRADGTYHGHITIAALFGNEIIGVDTSPGQTRAGPLDALQQGLLDPLCDGSGMQICLSAVTADSTTTDTGSTNRFSTARATLGGAANGVDVGAAESEGNISSDGTCQTSVGSSRVANATVAGMVLATLSESSSTSKACNDGTPPTQTNTSRVLGLGGTGVPVPAAGCADGTPDTETGVPLLLPIVCNADDSSNGGENQAPAPYGVREALDVFLLAVGTTQAAKITTAAAESVAAAPARAVVPPATPQCSDGVDNDGDGKIDFPNDPGCSSASDNSEADSGSGAIAQCSDGKDNDGDGKIDFPNDPGCSSASDNSEVDTANTGSTAQCSDGKDNDGDGKIDFPNDPGCSSASDNSEAGDGSGTAGDGSGTECNDGVDNDGDGKIDFPNDPGCSSAADDSEAGSGTSAGVGSLPLTGIDLGTILLLAFALGGAGTGLLLLARRRGALV